MPMGGMAMHHPCPDVPDVTPLGALPPALPMLCDSLLAGVPATFVNGANSWVDDFNHGASMADMGTGYVMFNNSSIDAPGKTGFFRHNNHWMVDIYAPGEVGGAQMRPDRSFKFSNGKLVIETDVAANILDYGGNADSTENEWPEIDVSTASSPAASTPYGPTPGKSIGDDLYGYGQFGGYDALGIRLQGTRPVEALYDTTQRGFPCGRTWELSWFQSGSAGAQCGQPDVATTWGGGEWAAPGAERTCNGDDPDTNCRDRFRWELTQDSITLYVNGQRFMEHDALPGQHLLPDAIVNGNVYVYLSSWVYKPSANQAVRFHWDRVAVNPPNGPEPAPGYVAP
jgi:hypothetical protein